MIERMQYQLPSECHPAFMPRMDSDLLLSYSPNEGRPSMERRLKVEFHGSRATSDAGLQAYRKLANTVGLTLVAGDELVDPREARTAIKR